MQKLLLFLCCLTSLGLSAQSVVLEDFEGGAADLPWNAYEGVYEGPVANPVDTATADPNPASTNTSAFVGSYTKGAVEYSYFVAELETPLDLTTNNQFSIQIYAGAATQLLMKLEKRGGGQSIERTVNIATADAWRTYTFDFSDAADLDSLNNLILFFDPGVAGSEDTYFFDNIVASPAGPCAGTEVDPTVIDDFECQRNATYGVPGFDDIMAIANPDKSGINTSDSVGEYTDREGAFHALVIDYNAGLDFSVNNNICLKVWAPVAGDLLIKVQDGTLPSSEVRVPVTETETWVEVCASFAGVATGNYKKLVFFFNVDVADADGDVYYIDDITRTPSPAAEALEDFEDGANLGWEPLDDNAALNGTFNGPIANPDMVGNTSATVGSYTRGSSRFSALTASLPDGLDLSGNPQLNLDVWAPNANTTVQVQLVSATAGPKNAEATVTAAMGWQTLSFNFEDDADVTDFERITIRFAPDTEGTDTYYFDNLTQGQSTVDACADVEVNTAILDDFECQRNATYAGGSEFLTAVPNPDGGEDSPNQSLTVGAFADQPGAFNALVIDYGTAIDLSLNNQLSATVWAPVEGQLLFKLEGEGVAAKEVFVDIDTVMAWSTYTVDFSAEAGMGYSRIVLFFGAGTENADVNTYYIDDIRLTRSAYVSSCVSTFDTTTFNVTNWQYFANGSFAENDFIVSDNPNKTGLNTSDQVGTFEEAADGEIFAGMYADLDAPVALPNGNKTMTMKVLMEVAGTVVLKLEGGIDGAAGSGDVEAEYTTPGEWQELTFIFSAVPDGNRYGRITLIMNRLVTPATNLTHYFDDIAVGGGNCDNIVSLFSPVKVADLRVYPNPVNEQLTIDNVSGATRFTLTNLLGQQVEQLTVNEARTQVQWPLGSLPVGTYLLTAQDRSGKLVARTKLIKR